MRVLLTISYDGTDFCGYQIQPNGRTVEEELEKALFKLTKQQIKTYASGRTDSGVHALCQKVHFDTSATIPAESFAPALNAILPSDVKVLKSKKVSDSFNARYSAKKKTYEYFFYIGGEVPVYNKFATNIGYNIDMDGMKNACKYFKGEKDFSAFCASNTSVKDKVRTIYSSQIIDLGDNLYKFQITGNGFLYNMVRIIMGTLVMVGRKKIAIEDIKKIIEGKDRSLSGKTMPSKGLYLKKVYY